MALTGRAEMSTTIEIKTRADGTWFVSVPDQGGYISVRRHGEMPKQPCNGGGFSGETLQASEQTVRKVMSKWLRQRREARNAA